MSILVTIGGIVFLVGWIWAIFTAFKMSGALWGIINIFFQPLTGIISAAMKKIAWLPVGLMVLGMVLFFLGGGMAMMNQQY